MERTELPEGWRWATIDEITEPVDKDDPSRQPTQEFAYLDISSIDNSSNRVVNPKYYLGANAPSRARQVVRMHDVLFSTVRTYLRNIALVPEEYDGQIASTGFCVLRSRGNAVGKYIYYYVLTNRFIEEISELQRGVSYPAVRDDDVRRQLIPLPPLPEQHAIVAAIETQFTRLDAAVAALKRVQANLRRYRASVLKAACEGRLVPTEAELAQAEGRTFEPASALLQRILLERRAQWQADHPDKKYKEPVGPDTSALPELPEGWCWATVEQLLAKTMMNGHSVPSADTGFPVLRLTAIRDGRIDLTERKIGEWDTQQAEPYLVRRGDFFVSRGNGSIRLVGRAGLVDLEPDQVAFPDTMIRVAPNDAIYPRYLRLVWDSPQMRRQIEGSAKTTAGIHKISQRDIGRYVVPLPPTREQQTIIDEVESQLSSAMALTTTLSLAEQRSARLRQSILQQAFSGQLLSQASPDNHATQQLSPEQP